MSRLPPWSTSWDARRPGDFEQVMPSAQNNSAFEEQPVHSLPSKHEDVGDIVQMTRFFMQLNQSAIALIRQFQDRSLRRRMHLHVLAQSICEIILDLEAVTVLICA